ncbi:MAG: cupin [Candidatus Melainabacteria bacterium]|nr:MAG: cupin [Candidatus Melainabacteria bacterium]
MVVHTTDKKKVTGTNFSCFQAGKFSELGQYEFKHPKLEKPTHGKLLVKDNLGLTGMQVSLNRFPAGRSMPFTHSHKENEELYIFVGGKGQMLIDREIIEVSEGTCIRVGTRGVRAWRNNSNEDLYFICVQAKENSLHQDTLDDGVAGGAPSWD